MDKSEAAGALLEIISKATEDGARNERNRWIGKLYDLKDKMRDQHEQYWEAERFEDAYGLSIAMDMIDEVIKEELHGQNQDGCNV